MIGDILPDAGQATAKAIAGKGVKAGFVPLDVTQESSWIKAVSEIISELGGFDILINNAGVEITSLVIDVKAADLERMCAVNIVGAGLGMKHAFRAMKPGVRRARAARSSTSRRSRPPSPSPGSRATPARNPRSTG